jgi:hypothetical protein
MDLNALPSVTTADLSQPASAEFFTAHGATPEQAAALAASHNIMSGRHGEVARTSISSMFDNMAPAAKPVPPVSATPEATADIIRQGEADELSSHLEHLYAPRQASGRSARRRKLRMPRLRKCFTRRERRANWAKPS